MYSSTGHIECDNNLLCHPFKSGLCKAFDKDDERRTALLDAQSGRCIVLWVCIKLQYP